MSIHKNGTSNNFQQQVNKLMEENDALGVRLQKVYEYLSNEKRDLTNKIDQQKQIIDKQKSLILQLQQQQQQETTALNIDDNTNNQQQKPNPKLIQIEQENEKLTQANEELRKEIVNLKTNINELEKQTVITVTDASDHSDLDDEPSRSPRLTPRKSNDTLFPSTSGTQRTSLFMKRQESLGLLEDDPTNALHTNARQSPYPGSKIDRFDVVDEFVLWDVEYKEYEPVIFTHDKAIYDDKKYDNDALHDKSEKHLSSVNYRFNVKNDNKKNRESWHGEYGLDETYHNLPLNPFGRTGMRGRGFLWRWGPNHAVDPIVTRWKRDKNGNKLHDNSNRRILEFIAIKKPDGYWAIPGGMICGRETFRDTLKRNFAEETMDLASKDENEKKKIKKNVSLFFETNELIVYKGYVDDLRGTDNAWIETVCVNYHDLQSTKTKKWKLKGGDDVKSVKWMKVHKNIKLYSSHKWLIKQVVNYHEAHW